jgi:hypothetical protein
MFVIKIEPQENDQKLKWNMMLVDEKKERSVLITELNFIAASLTNKYGIVRNEIEEISRLSQEFVTWYVDLIKRYQKSGCNSELLLEEVDTFKKFAQLYIDSKNVPFESFVDYSKASKTSIIFSVDDIKQIALSAVCLRMYSPFCYDEKMKPTDNVHKLIYSSFVKGCQEVGTISKIFQTMRSRTYRSSITDRYMWDLIRMLVLDTPESYTLLLFNFLMSNLLSTVEVATNPIPYFVIVTDRSLSWMMRSIYKDKVIYGEAFGGSDDIYGPSASKENLHILCCNDVIGKAAKAGMALLENEYGIGEEEFIGMREKLDGITSLSVSMKCVILPLASEVLEIPYTYLLKAPPKHIMLIGVLLYHCAKNVLDDRFPVITEFLIGCPTSMNTAVARSSYKIKNIDFIVNDNANSIFGLNSVSLRFEIMSCICGVLTASKKDLVSIINGAKLPKINYADLENDVIFFFSELYSGKLGTQFGKMRDKLEAYL